MSERSTHHATFVIVPTYAASLARVFHARAGPEAKTRSLACHGDWEAGRLEPAGAGARLTFAEQSVFLDGDDNAAQREEGTRELLESLAAEVRRGAAKEARR